MKRHLLVISLAAVGLAACATTPEPAKPAAAPAAAQKDIPSGPITNLSTAANLASNCFGCHGPDGRSPGTMPSLNKLSEKKITGYLKDFRAGTEPSTVMGRHAKGYSDAEIEAVAKYIVSLQKK